MLAIEEVERRILSELQEAGEENIAAMLNTIVEPVENAGQVEQLQQALENLVRADLARISFRLDVASKVVPLSRDESLSILSDLPSYLRFRSSDSHWTWSRDRRPEIVAMPDGLRKSDEILQQYGYQWWRPKK
jgi:hypothetical protein